MQPKKVKSWAVLDKVVVQNMIVDRDTARANVKHAMTLALPDIFNLPEWEKDKRGEPIAIVASGPSLRYTMNELAGFKTIMVAGSAHDFVRSVGLKPTYTVVCDPAPKITASYLSKPSVTCNYLIASMCDRDVFESLKDYPVTMWHCGGEAEGEDLLKGHIPPETITLNGGGCTVGLRCIDIANRLGYYEQHLFGFDTCIDPNTEETHSFALNDPTTEFIHGNGKELVDLKVGADKKTARTFRVPTYLIVQAWDFEKLLKTSGKAANFTVHGDGVINEMVRLYKAAVRGKG